MSRAWKEQSGAEMLESLSEDRARAGHPGKQGLSLYVGDEKDQARAESLSSLVRLTASQLAASLEAEPVRLMDTESVKRQTMRFLAACSSAGVLPTFIGLARALGYSRRYVERWRAERPDHDTSRFLDQFQDVCVECLNAAALNGKVHPIVSIFIQKSLNGLRETSELVVSPAPSSVDQMTIEDIRSRYEFDEEGEN